MKNKQVRLSHLINYKSNKSIFIPMDHGISLGPILGLKNIINTINEFSHLGKENIQGLILHKGCINHVINDFNPPLNIPFILHLSASTYLSEFPTSKALISNIEDALILGADAVSMHLNIGVPGDKQMLKDFGRVSSACQRWGMPLLVMVYIYQNGSPSYKANDLKLAVRMAAEFGADFVKIPYPERIEEMQEIVESTFCRVLIAGGEKTDNIKMLKIIQDIMKAGAAGVCIGRNIFQNNNISHILSLICKNINEQ